MQLKQPSPALVLPSSHCSLPSCVPLPHIAMQSLSLFALAPSGQQPSPDIACVIGECVQLILQFAALPVVRSVVHGFLSSQFAGHGMLVPASHVSPASITRLPHIDEQSRSF